MPKAKARKVAGTVTSSAPKKKKVTQASSKTLHSRVPLKETLKSCKSSTTKMIKSPKLAKDSGKTKASVAKRVKERRHHRELSPKEYGAFVVQAANREKVSPAELVTVDRRNAKSLPLGPPVTEQEPQTEKKQGGRQKIQRRRQIDPTTCERDYSQEEIEFMNALDEYKRNSGRMFPTCSEILEVFRKLGYSKLLLAESVEISTNPESGTMYRADEFHLAMNHSQG